MSGYSGRRQRIKDSLLLGLMAVQIYAIQDIGLGDMYGESCNTEDLEPAYIYITKQKAKSKRNVKKGSCRSDSLSKYASRSKVTGTCRVKTVSAQWNKSRGQPDSSRLAQTVTRESSFTLSLDDDDISSTCTPYRLPRLSPRTDGQSPNSDMDNSNANDESKSANDKVWSRYGYEKIIRIPELGPQIRMLVPPPSKSYSGASVFSATAPRFKNAAITPTVRAVPWKIGREVEDSHLQLYQRDMHANLNNQLPTGRSLGIQANNQLSPLVNKQRISSNHSRYHEDEYSSRQTRLEPTPTPISRSESPAKSVKSIHWILGHNRYHTFDKKGRSHIQGPYSREFNVTCMAPQNWLKMKWGRSKTMIH